MKAFQNKKNGVILRVETYNSLSYYEKQDYVLIEAEQKRNSKGDLVLSAVIGYATDSFLLGGLIGGSLTGGLLGDVLNTNSDSSIFDIFD